MFPPHRVTEGIKRDDPGELLNAMSAARNSPRKCQPLVFEIPSPGQVWPGAHLSSL